MNTGTGRMSMSSCAIFCASPRSPPACASTDRMDSDTPRRAAAAAAALLESLRARCALATIPPCLLRTILNPPPLLYAREKVATPRFVYDAHSKGRKSMIRLRIAAFAAAVSITCGALAQGYPSKPIKFVVPFPPGGNLDFVARALQPKMQEVLGQPVLIENKGGNAGMIGLEFAAKQPGDGYTIVLGNTGTIAINQSVYAKMNYDAVKDFVPIGITTTNALMATIAGNVPANNIQEFVA